MPWSQGRSLVWDFTCRDTVAPSYVLQSSLEAGSLAMQAQNEKLNKYENLTRQGYIVMPVSAETLGSWAPMAVKFIKDIGSKITDATGEKRATSYLFQSLGIAIQRGNAASISGTVPSQKELDEIYYL